MLRLATRRLVAAATKPAGPQVLCISTTNDVAGYEIKEYLGLVSGSTVRTRDAVRDFTSAARSMLGGELKHYTQLLQDSRDEALQRLRENAEAKGANAVIGLRMSTSNIANSARHSNNDTNSAPGASIVALFFRLMRSLSLYNASTKDGTSDGVGIQRVDQEYRELEKAVLAKTGRNHASKRTRAAAKSQHNNSVSKSTSLGSASQNGLVISGSDLFQIATVMREQIVYGLVKSKSLNNRILTIATGAHGRQPGNSNRPSTSPSNLSVTNAKGDSENDTLHMDYVDVETEIQRLTDAERKAFAENNSDESLDHRAQLVTQHGLLRMKGSRKRIALQSLTEHIQHNELKEEQKNLVQHSYQRNDAAAKKATEANISLRARLSELDASIARARTRHQSVGSDGDAVLRRLNTLEQRMKDATKDRSSSNYSVLSAIDDLKTKQQIFDVSIAKLTPQKIALGRCVRAQRQKLDILLKQVQAQTDTNAQLSREHVDGTSGAKTIARVLVPQIISKAISGVLQNKLTDGTSAGDTHLRNMIATVEVGGRQVKVSVRPPSFVFALKDSDIKHLKSLELGLTTVEKRLEEEISKLRTDIEALEKEFQTQETMQREIDQKMGNTRVALNVAQTLIVKRQFERHQETDKRKLDMSAGFKKIAEKYKERSADLAQLRALYTVKDDTRKLSVNTNNIPVRSKGSSPSTSPAAKKITALGKALARDLHKARKQVSEDKDKVEMLKFKQNMLLEQLEPRGRLNPEFVTRIDEWLSIKGLLSYRSRLLQWCQETGAQSMADIQDSIAEVADVLNVGPQERAELGLDYELPGLPDWLVSLPTKERGNKLGNFKSYDVDGLQAWLVQAGLDSSVCSKAISWCETNGIETLAQAKQRGHELCEAIGLTGPNRKTPDFE